VTLTGRVNKGVLYRSVESLPAGTCAVTNLEFTCSVTLQPREQAVLQVRLIPDAVSAPSYARQQLTVTVPGTTLQSTLTQSTPVDHPIAAASLGKQITDGPGALVGLLISLLLAFAATEAERRRRS